MEGFFPLSEVTNVPPPSLIPKCGKCGLYKTCESPKMPVDGKGRKGILIIGEATGKNDDENGKPFIGESGELLRETLDYYDISLREDCWITNALICRPPDNKIPSNKMVDYCRPNVMRVVKEREPEKILLFGANAVRSLIGGVWKADVGPLSRWVGWQIPSQKPNAWVCPNYHPAYFVRMSDNEVLRREFDRNVELAVAKQGRPWDMLPDYAAQVEVVMDTAKAARILRKMIELGGVCAVDFENPCLKPEYKGAEIICCAVCWNGKKTIAYPWQGEAIVATGELLESERIWKIASNMKHEHRWSRAQGFRVVNWLIDTMLAAHVLSNRRGVCGLKFQAFVELGAESYNDEVEAYLKQYGGTHINRAKTEIDLHRLLKYCGMDTVLEYFLGMKQIKKLDAL